MSNTYRCDRCKDILDRPTLEITRIDGMDGGGVPLLNDMWHLCLHCSELLTTFVTGQGAAGIEERAQA